MDLRISELEDVVSELSEEVRYLRGEVARLRRETIGSAQPRGAYQVDLDSRSAAASAGRRFGRKVLRLLLLPLGAVAPLLLQRED